MIIKRLLKLILFPVVVLGLLWIALFSASVYTYTSLTSESVVAEIRFEQVRRVTVAVIY